MDYFHKCSCSSGGGIEAFLDCAPCPPPLLSYSDLKTFALSKLCQGEICRVARRCRMRETSVMLTDCGGIQPASVCDLTCLLLIFGAIIILLVLTLIVTLCRRKKDVRQDTINVVFNDTESECSDKSSDKGTINMAMKRKLDTDYVDSLKQPAQPETNDFGARDQTTGEITEINVVLPDEQNRNGAQPHVNGHSQGVRNRTNVDGNDTHVTAKL